MNISPYLPFVIFIFLYVSQHYMFLSLPFNSGNELPMSFTLVYFNESQKNLPSNNELIEDDASLLPMNEFQAKGSQEVEEYASLLERESSKMLRSLFL